MYIYVQLYNVNDKKESKSMPFPNWKFNYPWNKGYCAKIGLGEWIQIFHVLL